MQLLRENTLIHCILQRSYSVSVTWWLEKWVIRAASFFSEYHSVLAQTYTKRSVSAWWGPESPRRHISACLWEFLDWISWGRKAGVWAESWAEWKGEASWTPAVATTTPLLPDWTQWAAASHSCRRHVDCWVKMYPLLSCFFTGVKSNSYSCSLLDDIFLDDIKRCPKHNVWGHSIAKHTVVWLTMCFVRTCMHSCVLHHHGAGQRANNFQESVLSFHHVHPGDQNSDLGTRSFAC